MDMDESVNVLDEPLSMCGDNPVTGFFRDSKCNTCKDDVGLHTVCVEASTEFLEYSRFKGNDLSTPAPEFGFEGVKPGNTWCLCAARWLEAHEDGMAPRVYLTRTHKRTLEIVPFELLKKFAADLN
jgi:uncharacterized protein (DUF2237 family)